MMTYPIILPPHATFASANRPFSISTHGKNKKVGASELVAFSNVVRLGLDCIREDIGVSIGGHRYEPDLVYINKEKGIYIDIEIDEPYSGGHYPTHYVTDKGQHKDTRRNETFCNAGWHVVRFTERQIFCQTKECMRLLFDLLVELGAEEDIPISLQKATHPSPSPCLTANEAIKLSHQGYRKTYLGYNPINMDFASYIRCCILIIPIILQSVANKRTRRMMSKQLGVFFRWNKQRKR